MHKALFLTGLTLCALTASAGRHIGFETDAFNRAYPVSYAKNMVFSPASFEIDCVLVAESLATIPKANVSEMMGAVLGFESTYAPILEGLSVRTNGFSFLTTRGFCVPEMKNVRVDHRIYLSRTYGAEIMRKHPARGAESWFRASMDGEMEDFNVTDDSSGGRRYSFYDLVSCKVAWRDPFPTGNTRELAFHRADDTNTVKVTCMSDVRVADTWEADEYTLLRLPLRGDAWFYAALPKEGGDLTPVRSDFSSIEIDHLLTVMKSVTEKGVSHGPCAIVLPRLQLRSRLDFSGILRYFRIPTKGLVLIDEGAASQEFVQHVRFSLTEHADGEAPLVRKPDDEIVPLTPDVKRLVFNRPFLFFVYHEPTETILAAGQFSGNGK